MYPTEQCYPSPFQGFSVYEGQLFPALVHSHLGVCLNMMGPKSIGQVSFPHRPFGEGGVANFQTNPSGHAI